MAYHLTTAYIIGFDLVVLSILVAILFRAGASRRLLTGLAVASTLFIGALAYLLNTGSLYSPEVSQTFFFASILVGIAAFGVVGLVMPIGKMLAKSPQQMLMLTLGLRVFFGAGFLVEGCLGIMPTEFAIADGTSHITAAFLCLSAAILLKPGQSNSKMLWAANIFGLMDLVVVACGLSLFLLDQVGPHHNVMLTALFAAPIFINLHLVSLWKLAMQKQTIIDSDAATSDKIDNATIVFSEIG